MSLFIPSMEKKEFEAVQAAEMAATMGQTGILVDGHLMVVARDNLIACLLSRVRACLVWFYDTRRAFGREHAIPFSRIPGRSLYALCRVFLRVLLFAVTARQQKRFSKKKLKLRRKTAIGKACGADKAGCASSQDIDLIKTGIALCAAASRRAVSFFNSCLGPISLASSAFLSPAKT